MAALGPLVPAMLEVNAGPDLFLPGPAPLEDEHHEGRRDHPEIRHRHERADEEEARPARFFAERASPIPKCQRGPGLAN